MATSISSAMSGAFMFEPDFRVDPRHTIEGDRSLINGAGPQRLVVEAASDTFRWVDTLSYQVVGHLGIAQLAQGYFDRGGAVRPAWVPSWLSDFQLHTTIAPSDTLITVKPGYTLQHKYARMNDMVNAPWTNQGASDLKNYWGLMLITRGGDIYVRRIESINQGPTNNQLTIDESFGDSVVVNDVTLFSAVYLSRATTGRLGFRYMTNDKVMINISWTETFYEAV